MTQEHSKISVIIPTHNRIDLLLRALQSVQKQTLSATEVIVIDDGSTDNTGDVVRGLYPEVCYIYQENKGVSAARNLGIKNANYSWIAFLDSDDEWLPTKLAVQMDALNDKSNYLICHTEEIWIRNGRRVNPMRKHKKYGGHIFDKCLQLCLISPSSVIVHKDLFKEVGLFDESLPACEDYDLWLRICSRHPVLFIEVPLIVKYGGHVDQLSRCYWGMDRFRIKALEKILQGGQLPSKDYQAAVSTLIRKIEIYIQGAKKRERTNEIIHFENKRMRYLKESF